ncbi:MAG: type IX secretion system PorP/SprF family membrane protein [Lentimonas sp.]|jgi:type IX secretion system PorP/SprF family membrane protein
MGFKIGRLMFFTFVLANFASAQDIHWSQFDRNPIYSNPGNSGNFNGTYRFVGGYRNQWKSVSVPYESIYLSADGMLPFEKIKDFGGGISLLQDDAGDGKFTTFEVQTNLSRPVRLPFLPDLFLSPGINLGINYRQFNPQAFTFDNQFNGFEFDPNLGTGEVFAAQQKTNISIGIGAAFSQSLFGDQQLSGGLAFFNLNRPNQGFFGQKIKRDVRTNFNLQYSYPINSDLILLPSININKQGKFDELIIGSQIKYIVLQKAGLYRALYGGLHFRSRDAFFVRAGIDYQNWHLGVSYDINISQLTPASNVRGGLEVFIQYILFQYKPKNVNHRICPDYI